MKELMGCKLKYTNAYEIEGDGRWNTESCGRYEFPDGETTAVVEYTVKDAKENTPLNQYPFLYSRYGDMIGGIGDLMFVYTRNTYVDRDEPDVHGSWWTTWTSIYDRKNKTMTVRFHERGNWIQFSL